MRDMTHNLLDDLNDSQRAAVEYCEGPQLVIAGAGAGKTRVLTYKIAYLLQHGYKPWNILALTFTNKAATEMKDRIGKLVGTGQSRSLRMGTFHSIFSRILRREAEHIGYTSNYTIYDEADSRSLLKSIIKEKGLDDKKYKPASIHSDISMAKNHLILASDYAANQQLTSRDAEHHLTAMSSIYEAYELRLRQANAMDFDDLLVKTYLLFRDHPDIRRTYAEHFAYVLVDEYQDTNYVQQKIVLQLTQESHKVCVVGDDYQSIYAFRGANIDNILNFQTIYPDAKLFKLEQNYRSTQNIVAAANSLMKHNKRQIDKNVYSRNAVGEKLQLRRVYSDKEEVAVVCNTIAELKEKEQLQYSDFAILYRTNAQSRPFEEEMRRRHIPYRIIGGLSFYQRKEIKDIIAYFRLVANPDDEEAFKRIINYPARGIGNTTVQKIAALAQVKQVSFWQVVNHAADFGLNVNRGTLAKLTAFTSMMSAFMAELHTTDAFQLGEEIIQKAGIRADLFSGNNPEDVARQQNLQEFLNALRDFVDEAVEEGRTEEVYLPDFLQQVSLLSDLDSADDSDEKVTLMTVHSAKGLEFTAVFVVGMEENIFPSFMSADSPRQLEEERRLFYVAITRAEKYCIVTCAKSRYQYGRPTFNRASRFLDDIDPRYIEEEDNIGHFEEDSRRCVRKPWEDDYEANTPYTGAHIRGSDYPQLSNRWQNSRPVAGQFMADPKRKITSPHKPEKAVDPLSDAFKQKLAASGGNLRRVEDAIANGGRRGSSSEQTDELQVGSVIEHQRFGIGKVIKIEGTGENRKAHVEFRNTGTKQLLLKFARYRVIHNS